MEIYNYLEAVTEDVREYINEEIILADWMNDRRGLEEFLDDELYYNDSITGNASGSYTFSTWQAEENLCHNMDLLTEVCEEYGLDIGEVYKKGAEYCDVAIRCYLLSGAISEVLDEMEANGYFNDVGGTYNDNE